MQCRQGGAWLLYIAVKLHSEGQPSRCSAQLPLADALIWRGRTKNCQGSSRLNAFSRFAVCRRISGCPWHSGHGTVPARICGRCGRNLHNPRATSAPTVAISGFEVSLMPAEVSRAQIRRRSDTLCWQPARWLLS